MYLLYIIEVEVVVDVCVCIGIAVSVIVLNFSVSVCSCFFGKFMFLNCHLLRSFSVVFSIL